MHGPANPNLLNTPST